MQWNSPNVSISEDGHLLSPVRGACKKKPDSAVGFSDSVGARRRHRANPRINPSSDACAAARSGGIVPCGLQRGKVTTAFGHVPRRTSPWQSHWIPGFWRIMAPGHPRSRGVYRGSSSPAVLFERIERVGAYGPCLAPWPSGRPHHVHCFGHSLSITRVEEHLPVSRVAGAVLRQGDPPRFRPGKEAGGRAALDCIVLPEAGQAEDTLRHVWSLVSFNRIPLSVIR